MARARKTAARTAANGGDNEAPDRGYAASSVIARGTVDQFRGAAKKGEERVPCLCGCGRIPASERSVFMPGHDSKVRHAGKQYLEGKIKASEIPAPARQYLREGGML
jgi:hypothetical protein